MKRNILLAAAMAATLAPLGCSSAPADEAPLAVSALYIDDDGDGALDTDLAITKNAGLDAFDLTAPDGVFVPTGQLSVAEGIGAGGAISSNGVSLNNFSGFDADNASAGNAARVGLRLENDDEALEAIALRGSGHSTLPGYLVLTIPANAPAAFRDAVAGSSQLVVRSVAGGDYVEVACDLRVADQIEVNALGTTSNPALHFTASGVPTGTGIGPRATTGDIIFDIGTLDVMEVNADGTVEVDTALLIRDGNGSQLNSTSLTMDLDGDAAALSYDSTDNRWELLSPLATTRLDLTRDATTLNADDLVVTASATSSHIRLISNSTTAADRTFRLSPGVEGQILVLRMFSGGGNKAQLLDDDDVDGGGGSNLLSANWEPYYGQTLTLLFDGDNWLELARSDN